MKAISKIMKPLLSSKKSQSRKSAEQETYIFLCYRSGIKKCLPTTYYDSDSGWGCMLRVGQMFLANLYLKHEQRPKREIINLCYDNHPLMPFSFQFLTEAAFGKQQYEWFSPEECVYVVKKILENFDSQYRVSICNGNTIFLNEISGDREKLIVFIVCRVGLEHPEPQNLKCILELMKNPYFNSILGGTPKRAHLFFKHIEGFLGYLDPHQTKKVPEFWQLQQKESQFVSHLSWVKQTSIDPSMALSFVIPQSEVSDFWECLEEAKSELGEHFFFYMEKEKPIIEEKDLDMIQIIDPPK